MSEHVNVRLFVLKFIPIGLILVSVLAAIFFGEILVRFIVNPGDFLYATMVDDPILGQRIKPHTTGHDALGFRNKEVPDHANVVAIGDSLTYGVSAPREGSWPHQLGDILHETVYNMALGGYGPLQYLYLSEHDARQLRPKLLLVGFYFGNDLIDAYRLAHHSPYWKSWIEDNSADTHEAEEEQSSNAEPKKHFAKLRDWLSRHSVLYSMLRVTIFPRLALWEQDSLASLNSPESEMIWTDPAQPSIRTIFTPQERLSVQDLKSPSVREGLDITIRAFKSIKAEADAQGAKLIIILIPTKERVYCRYLKGTNAQIPDTFISLCSSEEQIKERLIQALIRDKIAYVEVTKAMENETYQHVQLYPKDSDGHPLATGYGVIARTVYDTVHHLRQ